MAVNKSVTSRLENKSIELESLVVTKKQDVEYHQTMAKAYELDVESARKQATAVAQALGILEAAGVKV